MNEFTAISKKTPKTKRPVDKRQYQISSSIRKTPFTLDKRKKFTMGKLTKNDAVLKEGTISDIHASIKWEKSSFRLKDENSTNGTYLNGKRITRVTSLKDGDKIKIGKYVLTFSILKVRLKTDEKSQKKVVAKKVKLSKTTTPKKASAKTPKTKAVKKAAPKKNNSKKES